VSPRAFAVFLLITSAYFVGCSTGSSAGFAPLEDLVDVERRAPELMTKVAAVGHQPAESVSR
jgi:hypothetical protein